jgi:hypothetical protein
LENAERSGATVIQACLTEEHKPEFTNYVEDMKNLPEIVIKLVKKIKK